MTVAYRNLDAVVEERIERFRARRAKERAADETVKHVYALRAARTAAGGAGLAVGVALFVMAIDSLPNPFSGEGGGYAAMNTYVLLGAWTVAAIAGAVVWPFAQRRARIVLRRVPAVTGDTHDDLWRIDAADPLGNLRERACWAEVRSILLPLAALSMLVPLTLHWAVGTILYWLHGTPMNASEFGVWISGSVVFVGLAHFALAMQLVLWARSLRERPTPLLREGIHGTWGRIVAVTTGAGLFPAILFVGSGGIMALFPAALVAVTGMAFIPFLVVGTAKRIERERTVLASAR